MDLLSSSEKFKSKFLKIFIVFMQNNFVNILKSPALPSVVVKK